MIHDLGVLLLILSVVSLAYAVLAAILALIDAAHRWRWPR